MVQYKIVPTFFLGKVFSVDLNPVDRPDLDPLSVTIEIPEAQLGELEGKTFEEHLVILRKIVVAGNGGYQSDWESQLVVARVESEIGQNIASIIGKEFPEVKSEEVAALNPPNPTFEEVIF